MNKNNVGNAVLGELIKKKRIEQQITTKKMAELISISEKSYIKYEDGSLPIFIEHLMILSKILNIDIKTFFDTYVNAQPSV
ncbi:MULTISPECIES: helix-turn-helix domain-containing protein [Providencia]|uniref:Helix-turn-helix transcriptional regulator n=1 Tax=Providencia rettgeri TaxID=587 RepID=A0A427HMZ8_PRORE|nr:MULTISPECIES: helix-turn-helix transcriptional regulator [Providencia]ELR5072489.1 helix-turn-helix transcriptional regulator [Providencia stuartii]ELR5068870.1 helix-turn-helix transcriptional regulator [Providencia rettgeri]ELR5216360.1 helix-turn-helix transcriptional regulator [Providencia rettgeri]ELR5219969.1 helix-turn-helix transcriptional regulator [Providencia rettgeri]ELR5223949.1 helix-turn-helix transcriptional regulator [Providencia rettgeri]